MPEQPPLKLKSLIPAKDILQVEQWWEKLSPENQENLLPLYEESLIDDETMVSIYLCGSFVEQEQKEERIDFWINHLFEYLINHEMITHEDNMIGGTCSAHPKASEAIRNGFLNKDFSCPLNHEQCLMRSLLSKGKHRHLKMKAVFKLE